MSKAAIEGLKPEILWQRFYEISQIPRPSKNEGKVVEYLRKFAKEHNLEMKEDKVSNIVMKIPATPGYENVPVVVIQGHVDMVCEKNKGTVHDFDNDPIKLIRDGDWLKADGTTLGADNGIGVAAGLAAVTDDSFVHGPLEVLCTVDEETGLTGANNLEKGFITGKMMLNLDSEEDGVFYIGCSGGLDTVGLFDIQYTEPKPGLETYELMVTGLKGGHSGLDVANGRANAIKLIGKLLNRLSVLKFRIAEINGGSKRNAIPREAEAKIMIDPVNEEKAKEIIDQFVEDTLLEFKVNDGGLEATLTKLEVKPKKVFRKKFTRKIIDVILAMPHGILAMSPDIEGLVETSTNLATIFTEGDILRIGTSQRSSVEPAKVEASNIVKAVLDLAGAEEISTGDGYPGWQPNLDSKLLKFSREFYKKKFGEEAEMKAIHAGLECGILGALDPELDMISFGPTIQNAHSPAEMVNIPDVEKFWELVKGIISEIAEENK